MNFLLEGSSKSAVSQAIYEKTNRFVEILSGTIYAIGLKLLLPIFVMPKAILSYFIYFTTDAGRAAFELPIPAW